MGVLFLVNFWVDYPRPASRLMWPKPRFLKFQLLAGFVLRRCRILWTLWNLRWCSSLHGCDSVELGADLCEVRRIRRVLRPGFDPGEAVSVGLLRHPPIYLDLTFSYDLIVLGRGMKLVTHGGVGPSGWYYDRGWPDREGNWR
jgi:hypothetical protein